MGGAFFLLLSARPSAQRWRNVDPRGMVSCLLLAQSGHTEACPPLSAFGGEADTSSGTRATECRYIRGAWRTIGRSLAWCPPHPPATRRRLRGRRRKGGGD